MKFNKKLFQEMFKMVVHGVFAAINIFLDDDEINSEDLKIDKISFIIIMQYDVGDNIQYQALGSDMKDHAISAALYEAHKKIGIKILNENKKAAPPAKESVH